VADILAGTGANTCNYRQSTGHGLEDRQIKGIFQRRADIGIGRGVKLHNIARGLVESHRFAEI
jgi:hypothetical protein